MAAPSSSSRTVIVSMPSEIERSGLPERLEVAAQRLKKSGKPQKVLQVPQKDMSKAAEAMRKLGVGGTVKNLSGTKRISVPRRGGK